MLFVCFGALLLGGDLTLLNTYIYIYIKCYHRWTRSKAKQALCVWFLPALEK